MYELKHLSIDCFGLHVGFLHRLVGIFVQPQAQSLDLIVPDEYRARHARLHHAMDTGESRLNGAATNRPVCCQDGTVRLFPALLVLIKDARDRPAGAMGSFAAPSGREPLFGPIV